MLMLGSGPKTVTVMLHPSVQTLIHPACT